MTTKTTMGMAFEPRSVVSAPSAFGRVSTPIPPAEGFDQRDHQYRAAMVQHTMARIIHNALLISEQSLPQFLAGLTHVRGMSPDRVRRMLRGETAAQLADIAFWSAQFPQVALELAVYVRSWAPRGMEYTSVMREH